MVVYGNATPQGAGGELSELEAMVLAAQAAAPAFIDIPTLSGTPPAGGGSEGDDTESYCEDELQAVEAALQAVRDHYNDLVGYPGWNARNEAWLEGVYNEGSDAWRWEAEFLRGSQNGLAELFEAVADAMDAFEGCLEDQQSGGETLS